MDNQLAKRDENTNTEIAQFDDKMLHSFVGANNLNLSENEFMQFIEVCRAFDLNPFKKEIYIQKFKDQFALIVGYQTYIQRAEKTGKLDGWNVEISDDDKTATITIHRKDFSKPFKWTVDRKEFDKQRSTWNSMPRFMLKKVAIAQGFRMCFPSDIGGMPYTKEEQDSGIVKSEQVEVTVIEKDTFTAPEKEETETKKEVSEDEQQRLALKRHFQVKAKEAGHKLVELNKKIIDEYEIPGGISDLTVEQIKKVAKYYGIEL